MQVSGSSNIKKNVLAASQEILKNIDQVGLSEQDKEKVKKSIENTQFTASEVPNTFVYWLAVGTMGLVTLVIVHREIYLLADGSEKTIPEFLRITLATAIGALAGMVVPSGRAS